MMGIAQSGNVTQAQRMALLGIGLFAYQADMSLARAVAGNAIGEMREFYRNKYNPREIAEKIALADYSLILVALNGGYLRHKFSKHALRDVDFALMARLLFDLAELLEGETKPGIDPGNLRWCFNLMARKFCRIPPGLDSRVFSQIDCFFRHNGAPPALQIEDVVGRNWLADIPTGNSL